MLPSPDDRPSAGPGRSALAQMLAQQAAVASIGQRALSEKDLGVLLDEAVALVARILETELVDVLELALDAATLKIVAGVGWRPGVVGHVVVGADRSSQSGYTVTTGGPVVSSDLRAEQRFEVPPVLTEHGAISGMSVRIGESERPYGVLAAFTSRQGRFTRDDAHFLQAVANVLAGAIGRLRAEGELRRSRDELAAIVASVTDGITVQGRDGRLVFANDSAARLTGFSTGTELIAAPLTEVMGRFELLDENGQHMPADHLPSRRALAGETPTEMLVRFRLVETGAERWSVVQASPVLADDGSVAQVVNVFRDVTDEKRSQDARRFLTEALATVASTLQPLEAARRLAALCVPQLADYCAIDLLEPDGDIDTVAEVHAAPAKGKATAGREATGGAEAGGEASSGSGQRRQPSIRLVDMAGRAEVTRDGRSELLVNEAVHGSPGDAQPGAGEGRPAAQEFRSRLTVPLLARGLPIGALTLATAGSGRVLDDQDLRLAQELGARAGIALDNARLYEAVDDRRAELDAVLAAMAEAVMVFDARGRLRLHNRSAERLFGRDLPHSAAELRTRLAIEAQPTTDAADSADLEGEVELPGTSQWLELRRYRAARRAADHGARGAPSVVILRDVTDARAARAAREAFLGVLSHELRTPITTIYGGSELLERGLDEPRRGEVIRDIRAESERLARLIEDLLVMTRVERGGVEVGDEPVLVQRILPGLASTVAARWPALEVEMQVADGLPAVRGDVTYLEQVLRNLLTNAVRYGDGASKGVTITADERSGEVVIRVLDSGPGIQSEEPERLFDLFYRAPSARSVAGGAGIGLFVCRHLVEAMGGRIWANNRPEGGAEFGFVLPVLESDIG